jgi:hypothetical protein
VNRNPYPAFQAWQPQPERPAPRQQQPEACVWSKCPKRAGMSYPGLPLCDAHVQIVHQRVMSVKNLVRDALAQRAAEQKAADEAKEPSLGWIYYLLIGEHIKVGYASSLPARMMAYPPTSTLLAAHHGTLPDEAALHKRFRLHLAAGREWYHKAEPLLEHIASVVAEHGTPPDPFKPRAVRQAKAGSLNRGVQMRSRSRWGGGGSRVG